MSGSAREVGGREGAGALSTVFFEQSAIAMFAKYMLLEDKSDDSHLGQAWLRWRKVSHIDEVLDALSTLDGDRHSMLIVSENPPPGPGRDEPFFAKALSICGGEDGQYLCEAYIENEYTPIRLCNPRAANPEEEVWVTCGQPETVRKRHVVNGDMVRRALVEFVEMGNLSDDLNWEQ